MGFKWLQKQLVRAIRTAGNNNLYQYTVITLLCLIFFLDIFLIIGPSIYFMDPVFRCPLSPDPSRTYDESYACEHLPECEIINDYTIVYKMGLYCQRQYERSLIQSSLSVGSLLGLFVMNFVSDLKGRKYALLTDLLLAALSALLTYIGATLEFTPLLVLASIISGFSGYSLIIIAYIMLGDICEQSLRQRSSVYINACLSLGIAMFFVIDNWCNQWYTIVILFMVLPLGAVALACWVMVEESPNFYLFQLHDGKLCVQSLVNMAKINGKNYVDCQKIKYIVNKIKKKLDTNKKQNIRSNIITSLVKWKYLKIILCMFVVESGGNLIFYAIQYAINDIGYSFGIMNLSMGTIEIVTTLTIGQIVVRLPRKRTLAMVYGAVPVLTSLFMIDFVGNSLFLSTIVILTMRVMTTTGYYMIVMIQTQSFPLEIQSIGAGSIEGLSQLGSLVAPILNAFSINHGLPKISVAGFAMLFCLIPLIFVPESSSLVLKKEVKKTEEELRQVKSEAPYRSWL